MKEREGIGAERVKNAAALAKIELLFKRVYPLRKYSIRNVVHSRLQLIKDKA